DNTVVIFTGDNGSSAAGQLLGEPYPKGKGGRADWGVHVPFIVRAPSLSRGGRVSRDLIDFTDLYVTMLDMASMDVPAGATLDGVSFVPSLRGGDDPFEKRNWIYSQIGDFRMIRDWHHILDSAGNFHDLDKDPRQEREVSPLDKMAPGRRQRLQMILDRFPADAEAPFPEFAAAPKQRRQKEK
ncbi:MAG: sulfatase-like hydrolase/transferase, partial [Pirellulaceae bacterium]|nr:sulfatase-like hydrolase/transferase [Pirellulaceae bacterium]